MVQAIRLAIADDEPEVREYFAAALRQQGYAVVAVVGNGAELVAQCHELRPDLVITDIRMEGLNGIEAMQEIARDQPIPTILISAHFQHDQLDDGANGHVVACLPKPVKLATLIDAVEQAVRRFDD